MTLKLNQFGEYLVTRQDAKRVLDAISGGGTLVLDFAGVDVANHCFADELGKGLLNCLGFSDLSSVQVSGANPYIKNCVAAGFSTATV